MRYTDELRIKAGKQWDRVINHRFTKELATGGVGENEKAENDDNTNTNTNTNTNHFKNCIMKKYLIQDHRFLDSFVILLASIIAKLPCLEDRIPGCQFIAVITGSENTYFERCFNTLNITKQQRSKEVTPNAIVTTKFCQLMIDVSVNGNLEEMLAVIVVCEWSYLLWANILLKEEKQNENSNKINRNDFITYEWIQLHSGTEFENVVNYLRNLLDREGIKLKAADNPCNINTATESKKRLDACEKRFLQTIQLEEDFFDHLYQDDEEEEEEEEEEL